MREIKFKVWDLEKKQMVYPEQLLYIQFAEGLPIQIGYRYVKIEGEGEINGEGNYIETTADCSSFELLQYTGIENKSGEVYEGDVVKGSNEFKTDIINEIIFECGEFKHKDSSIGYEGEELISLRDTEILGNIYENPELLKRINHFKSK